MNLGEIINNKYQLLELIDENERQFIFKSVVLKDDRQCAIKIIKKRWLKNGKLVNRMIKEVEYIASLRHKNLIKIIDVDLYDGIFYIVEEWVDGLRLDCFIDKGNLLPPEKALIIVKRLAYLLEYAMKNGLEYRSIKISNILITKDFDIKVLGFNIPRRFKSTYGKRKNKNTVTDPDIFFLGVLLYSLLTGKFPIKKKDFIITDIRLMKYLEIESDWKLNDQSLSEAVRVALEELIYRSVTKETNKRISGFYEVFAKIDRIFEYLNKEKGDVSAWEVIESLTPSKEEFWREEDNIPEKIRYSGTINYAFLIAALLLAVYWLI